MQNDKEVKEGRPTKYSEAYNQQVYKLCLLGATDVEIADFFEVCEKTINNWKDEHPEFLQSIKKGKTAADMDVAFSLYETTKDREVTEVKAIKCKEVSYNNEGKRVEKETVKLVPETRIIPADYRSQSLWLRNRQSAKWKDKQEVDHTTNGASINNVVLGQGVKPPEE